MLSTRICIIGACVRNRFTLKQLQIRNTASLYSNNQKNDSSVCHRFRSFSTEKFEAKDPDVFGDIGGSTYEKLKLDEDELEQEEFEKNEHSVPRRMKPSAGQYADLIKQHVNKRDLKAALEVLDLVKENRDKPTNYMYNLLIRAFAVQGDLHKCLKLYNDMKKRALPRTGATYTSMLNACANSNNRLKAIEALTKLRNEFLQKSVVLNETNYNTMIKAYGKHQLITEAFTFVDEMVDKKMNVGDVTFNSLIFASISDKENGLRHALTVWHLMNRWRVKTSIITYNLLLRAIRDTKLGDLKANDFFLPNFDMTKILVSDSKVPDLLANPPVVSSLLLGSNDALNKDICLESSAASLVPAVTEKQKVHDIPLDKVHEKNKLILFGGYTGFIERMEKNGIEPDAKTLTLILDIVPDSLSIENSLIQLAREKKITLDIDFYNMLIKKRSFRKDYKHAKEVLNEIQRSSLHPDVITWGVLALGCQSREDAHALLDGMEATGHTLNVVIAGTLIANACTSNNIPFILDIMGTMKQQRIKPTERIYSIIDKFILKMNENLNSQKSTKRGKNPRYKENLARFSMQYKKWQEYYRQKEENRELRQIQRSR